MSDRSQSKSEQQSIENYELIPRSEPINRPAGNSFIKQNSMALNLLSPRQSDTPNKKSDSSQNQSTQKPPTPNQNERHVNPYQTASVELELLEYRKTISQQSQIIQNLQKLLLSQREQSQLSTRANTIYTDNFTKLKDLLNQDSLQQMVKKIEEMVRSWQPKSNSMLRQRVAAYSGDPGSLPHLLELKNEQLLELTLEIEGCHAKIQELRNELLKSSENNIFALFNLPIPSNMGAKQYQQIQLKYHSLYSDNKWLKEEIAVLREKIRKLEETIIQERHSSKNQQNKFRTTAQTHALREESYNTINFTSHNRENIDNFGNNPQNSQIKSLMHLIDVLREDHRQAKGKFDTLKNEITSIFGVQKSKLIDVDRNRQLIIELSERLRDLAESMNTPEIAKLQPYRSIESEYDPEQQINLTRALKEKVKQNQQRIEEEILKKNSLEERIQQMQFQKEQTVSASVSKLSRLESKMKEKGQRIVELENTIMDHIESNSRRDNSQIVSGNSCISVSPDVIERYQNHMRNFKVLLKEARKDAQKLKEELHEANEEKEKRANAFHLLQDYLLMLKQLYRKIDHSNFSMAHLKQDLDAAISEFTNEVEAMRNQVSSLSANSRRRSICQIGPSVTD